MAKKRGRELGVVEEEEVKAPEDDLYVTPEHLKVCSCFRPEDHFFCDVFVWLLVLLFFFFLAEYMMH